jgi:hypothetical protein
VGVKRKGYILVVVMVWTVASLSSAVSIVYVDVSGPNTPGTGSLFDPFQKIQDALDVAANEWIIEIKPGLYTGPGNYNLDPNGKSITIRSTDPNNSDIVENTIIDPNQAGRGFYIHSGEDANCVISGLTIRNAYIEGGENGAGIYCYNSSPTIQNCVIRDCIAEEGSGGGICLDYGTASIVDCVITNNTAGSMLYGYGGGISCISASPTITGCTIKNNTAYTTGGGIDSGASDANISNCIIMNNNAMAGGGINCFYTGATQVINCTIILNSAEYSGGAVYSWNGSDAYIENSILWENSSVNDGAQLGLNMEGSVFVSYSDVQGGPADVYDPCGLLTWGKGNIDTDPCFASFDPNGDPNFWDFHIKSKYGRLADSIYLDIDVNNDRFINLVDFAVFADSWREQGDSIAADLDNNGYVDAVDLGLLLDNYLAGYVPADWVFDDVSSPCIDAGDLNSKWSEEPWPNGRRINIGAFGGTTQASMNGNVADFNVSGMVDLVDFAWLSDKWMTEGNLIEDLSDNGVVDFADLKEFAENWLWQRE